MRSQACTELTHAALTQCKLSPLGQAPKDNLKEGSSPVTLTAIVLDSVIAEPLKGSFEGLRDSMDAGFAGLGNLIASHSGDDDGEDLGDVCDSSVSKDYIESLVEDEPPVKKQKPNESGKNSGPLITKLIRTLQLTDHVGPAIDGELVLLVDQIIREKANEDKITE